MKPTKIVGIKSVFGLPAERKEITGVPYGRQRLRLRAGKSARLFVRTNGTTSEFLLEDKPHAWVAHEIARNQTLK